MSFKNIARTFGTLALLVAAAAPAAAQSVQIQFHDDGRVSLTAQDAPVRTILAEWARVGGTTIVNAERVTGAPVTLELTNVPERQALDVVLRNVSGYMAGPRGGTAVGTSVYDRVMILPTSTPARAAAPAPVFTPPPQPQEFPQIDLDDPEENPITDIAPEPEFEGPDGPEDNGSRRRFEGPGFQPSGANIPPTQPDPDVDPQEQPEAGQSNPFGIQPGSSRPGVITPVPRQPGEDEPQDGQER